MKKVSSIFIVISILLFSIQGRTQTPPISVEKMQVLLNKAVGQHYVSTWLRDDELITQQSIASDSFVMRYTVVRYDRKMATVFTELPWDGGFTYISDSATGNPDLVRFTLAFEKDVYLKMYYGTAVLADHYTQTKMVFFVRLKDAGEMNRLLKN